ncbi:hypothetical protein BDZ97DRAFT_1841630 [Flammula alnicola]|nr:hypothetical protein BDZ97DRAFT_1841630 [Flammula alnicola]
MPPLGQRAQSERQCANCSKSMLQTHLLACSGCKLTLYCSRECQKNHWTAHKSFCSKHQNADKLVQAMAAKGVKINDVPVLQVDRRFKKWHSAAQAIIDQAIIAAMDFVNHPERCFTHVVLITVKSNLYPSTLKASTSSDILKQFLIDYAYICRIDELPNDPRIQRLSGHLHQTAEASRKARAAGTGFGTALAVTRFHALKMTQLTHLFLNNAFNPAIERRSADWVADLKQTISSGTVM